MLEYLVEAGQQCKCLAKVVVLTQVDQLEFEEGRLYQGRQNNQVFDQFAP